MDSFPETYNDQRSQSHHLYLPLLGQAHDGYYRRQGQQAPWTSEVGLPSHNGRQCEADALPVSGEVPGEAPDSTVVPKPILDRACTKASHTKCQNVVKR